MRRMKVFFDDGEKISFREGNVSSQDEFSIELDHKHVIPRGRIIRMEVLKDGSD